MLRRQQRNIHSQFNDETSKPKQQTHAPVVPTIVFTGPDLLLTKAQISTSYLVSGLSTGVVYCLSVAVHRTVLLQPPGGPLDGLSRYLSR